MNGGNKDTLSLMSLRKMRDSSYYSSLFCIINNLKKYQLSFVIQRRKLAGITLPVLTLKHCNPAVKHKVPQLSLLWAVGTEGEN